MDKEEIRSKRQYACDVGHNAGQCIGNMARKRLLVAVAEYHERWERAYRNKAVACEGWDDASWKLSLNLARKHARWAKALRSAAEC